MKFIFTLALTFCLTCTFGQNTTLYFEKDSPALTPSSQYALNQLAERVLKSDNRNEMGIIGHTDTDASEKYNETLALKRAHAVRDFLMKKGLKNRFSLFSRGETSTLNKNLTVEEKKVNRRVEIILNYSGAEGYGSNDDGHQSTLEMMSEIDQEAQVFVIDPRKGAEIITEGGTIVTIDPRVFKTELFATPIEIQIKEYYDKDRFVLGNLTTRAENGEMIESRGMIYITAIQKEDTLELERGNTIGVLFPDRELNDNTELFWGLMQGGEVIWKQMSFENNAQEGGETNWYQEGPYVRRSRFRYEKINEQWNKITRTEIKNKVIMDTAIVTPTQLKKMLTFRVPALGFINCDRFVRDARPKRDVVVEVDKGYQPQVYVIFDEISSVMTYSYRENNRFIFSQLPVGMKISVIGIEKTKIEGEVNFAIQKMKTAEKLVANLKFSQINTKELEQNLLEVRGKQEL